MLCVILPQFKKLLKQGKVINCQRKYVLIKKVFSQKKTAPLRLKF